MINSNFKTFSKINFTQLLEASFHTEEMKENQNRGEKLP